MAFNLSPIRAFGSTLQGGIYIFVMIIVSVIINILISFGLVEVRASWNPSLQRYSED